MYTLNFLPVLSVNYTPIKQKKRIRWIFMWLAPSPSGGGSHGPSGILELGLRVRPGSVLCALLWTVVLSEPSHCMTHSTGRETCWLTCSNSHAPSVTQGANCLVTHMLNTSGSQRTRHLGECHPLEQLSPCSTRWAGKCHENITPLW